MSAILIAKFRFFSVYSDFSHIYSDVVSDQSGRSVIRSVLEKDIFQSNFVF